MPRRRPFGSVYRRRRRPAQPGGRADYYPGWYLRIRRDGREVVKYAGLNRATALEVLGRYRRESERRELLDELPERASTLRHDQSSHWLLDTPPGSIESCGVRRGKARVAEPCDNPASDWWGWGQRQAWPIEHIGSFLTEALAIGRSAGD